MKKQTACTAILAAFAITSHHVASADIFGAGAMSFSIDFKTIGNAGNSNDAGAGGGSWSSPFGGVSYIYRIGTYEVSQNDITMATANGMTNVIAGAWTGNRPAADLSWYEAAAFANWLNTSTGHQAAYNLIWTGSEWSMSLWSSAQAWQLDGENLFRHKDAFYFLPSEDEWYKAPYHQNDGVTQNYWDYATGSNSVPVAVANGTAAGTTVTSTFSFQLTQPADVFDAGGLNSYGTMGQNGNVTEWVESAGDGINSSPTEDRSYRGGDFSAFAENSSVAYDDMPSLHEGLYGLRVASAVPEPSTTTFGVASLLVFLTCRFRNRRNG